MQWLPTEGSSELITALNKLMEEKTQWKAIIWNRNDVCSEGP